MTELSTSKDRWTRRKARLLEQYNNGKMSLDRTEDYMAINEDEQRARYIKEINPEFRENNLEFDLRSNDWIIEKVRSSDAYSQNLYAALCNRDFVKATVEDTPENLVKILAEGQKLWSCSWRYAGGIIADMRGEGDYIDWYCSGIRDTYEPAEDALDNRNYVQESVVTDEIRHDLRMLGWNVLDEEINDAEI